MTGALDFMEFRVQYKLPKKKSVTTTFVCESLKDLMQTLKVSEGVTLENVDNIYVHYTVPGTNETVECVARENVQPSSEVAKLPTANNVTDIREMMSKRDKKKDKKDKPHIKLKAEQVEVKPEMPVYRQGFYKASAEPKWS